MIYALYGPVFERRIQKATDRVLVSAEYIFFINTHVGRASGVWITRVPKSPKQYIEGFPNLPLPTNFFFTHLLFSLIYLLLFTHNIY